MKLLPLFNAFVFVVRNAMTALRVPVMHEEALQGRFLLGPCTPDRFDQVVQLYVELHNGEKLGWARETVLRLFGKRLCVVLKDLTTERVVGLMFGYFNGRDIRERTVHIGFTGLAKEFRGQGLSNDLRRFAYTHFARASWLRGVSSRISLDNHASLHGAIKLGYVELERYYDETLGVERAYMFCDLTPYREN